MYLLEAIYFRLFHLYGYLACICIFVDHFCAVSEESRRGCLIPLPELQIVVNSPVVLGIKFRSSGRAELLTAKSIQSSSSDMVCMILVIQTIMCS